MGRLVDGQWRTEDVNPDSPTGEYKRQEQAFRDEIKVGGKFEPESGRYHLYVSYACPWAHRTLIMRELKELRTHISFSVVNPDMLESGWSFKEDFSGVIPDSVFAKTYLKDIYTAVDPHFTGKTTVPILLDKKTKKIVNNESSEIIRIFNTAFNSITGNEDDYYSAKLRGEIDRVNEDVYHHINNGVYQCGFARSQEAYDKAVYPLFESLDRMESRLKDHKYLVGESLTEADIRFYTTLVRFDIVYYLHFKCNLRMIRDYPNLSRYLTQLYSEPAFKVTTRFDHIKRHYYYSHPTINPFRILPIGPEAVAPFGGGIWTY